MISTTINNYSTETQNKCTIKLHLFNEQKSKITDLTFLVDQIDPDGKSTLFTISAIDLSNCSYYSLSIQ